MLNVLILCFPFLHFKNILLPSQCSSEGRPLSVDELTLLQEGVAGLHEEIDLVSMDDSSTEGPSRRSTEGSTTRSVSFDPKKDTQIANDDHKGVEIDYNC